MANHKITIYHDGTILTMDADFPQVEALAVMDGRIVATGSLKDVKQAVGDGADLVSLEGGTLLPGFIDGHSHFCSGGMNRLYAADCAVENMEALKKSLRRKLHDDRPSQWVVGHSFDEKGMEEQCYPIREILDEVSTDVPIFFRHVTGHTGIANSKALEIAGITRDTPDPAGGIIGRDAQGEPNGILEGIPAQTLVRKHIPAFTLDEMRAALADDSARYASCGITTAQGGPAFSPMDAELGHKVTELVLDCAHDGTLTIRTVLFIRANDMSRLAPYPNHVPGTDLSGNGRVTMGAAKLWADGDPRGHTGYFLEPYPFVDPAKGADYRGEFLYTVDELVEKILPIHKAGWQIAIHANGDGGIEIVTQAYERLQQLHPRPNARHLVIHCQYPSYSQLQRLKAAGAYPCFFISPLYHWGEIHAGYVGADRVARFCPCHDADELGLPYNLHTDAPITPVDPLIQVCTAVTRTSRKGTVYGPDQAVTVMSALKAVTIHAAFLNFEEHVKGSLTPGKYADMVLLAENPLTVAPEHIKDIAVLRTYVGGDVVYSRS